MRALRYGFRNANSRYPKDDEEALRWSQTLDDPHLRALRNLGDKGFTLVRETAAPMTTALEQAREDQALGSAVRRAIALSQGQFRVYRPKKHRSDWCAQIANEAGGFGRTLAEAVEELAAVLEDRRPPE